jgi:hypothetical protein
MCLALNVPAAETLFVDDHPPNIAEETGRGCRPFYSTARTPSQRCAACWRSGPHRDCISSYPR